MEEVIDLVDSVSEYKPVHEEDHQKPKSSSIIDLTFDSPLNCNQLKRNNPTENSNHIKNAFSVLMTSSKRQKCENSSSTQMPGKPNDIEKSKYITINPTQTRHFTITNSFVKESRFENIEISKAQSTKPLNLNNPKMTQTKRNWNNRNVSSEATTGSSTAGKSSAPGFKRIQVGKMSKPIVVDGFKFASAGLSDCYFLTHFHSDHYVGLLKSFNCGRIYCTEATANLVKLKLRVDEKYIIPCQMETKYTISCGEENVEVVFMEANHCPGAACILFDFPYYNRKILHTGDFRWHPKLLSSLTYKSLADEAMGTERENKSLAVYLDTTYCDIRYDFPDQDEVIKQVKETVRKEAAADGSVLFLFGAYSIGKEKAYLAAAEELNDQIYVEKHRLATIKCYGWSDEILKKFTTDCKKSNIWVVPMKHINLKNLQDIKDKYPKYDRIVGFRPTGWTHTPKKVKEIPKNNMKNFISITPTKNKSDNIKIIEESLNSWIPSKKGNCSTYAIPYSEHSSVAELVLFIKTFRPDNVIPTVNTSKAKVQEQLNLLKTQSGIYNK